MVININAVAFSPVSNEIESGNDDDWVVSTRTVDIDDRVMGIFVGYLTRVINKEDNGKVTVGHFSNGTDGDSDAGDQTQERLDRILDLDLDDEDSSDYTEFEDLSESLKNRLITHMDGRTSRGYLFTIQAVNDGEPFVGILKLDVVESEERPILDRDTRQLEYEEIENAFPPTDDLQKGCTYPIFDPLSDDNVFNLDGDVKFLQEDSDSEYFEEFMGCVTSSGSREQSQTILNGLSEIKQEQDDTVLGPDEVQDARTTIQGTDGVADSGTVHEAAEQALGEDYDEGEVDEMLYEEGETEVQIDPNNTTKYVVYDIDGIKIKAKMSDADGDKIDIQRPEHEDGEYVVTIRGDELDQDFQG
ncbi:nucleoid-associated protein [Halorussus litoreus]|uniref:nucleoid-associated protein n=1 Tax=Halorussus litoreus TaxID=1710536 RepID=UPI000E269889|nr:nucleoid-associated protein [Halorussus litoreus]